MSDSTVSHRSSLLTARSRKRAAVFLGAAGAALLAGVWFAPLSWASSSAASGASVEAAKGGDGGCEH